MRDERTESSNLSLSDVIFVRHYGLVNPHDHAEKFGLPDNFLAISVSR
ncbi:MAG: hypothetical protein M3Y21_04570 [Candidatus Eremiobacteraeota bacterium]|nr:hypothetical protein [Candidatus Eremiobacteraeota bacterium]